MPYANLPTILSFSNKIPNIFLLKSLYKDYFGWGEKNLMKEKEKESVGLLTGGVGWENFDEGEGEGKWNKLLSTVIFWLTPHNYT